MEKNTILILIFLILLGFSVITIYTTKNVEKKSEIQNCITEEKIEIVNGNSLHPLIKDGEEIKALFNYYDCNDVKREDLVLFSYSGNSNPLIKIIKAIPGDNFSLKQTEEGANFYYMLIDNEILKNSENKPYALSEDKYRLLALYEDDYKEGIPENTYLLLSNIPQGGIDSTHFGFVDKKEILAKVQITS